MAKFNFKILVKDRKTKARVAKLQIPHGTIQTPCYVPVGTQAAVKALSPKDLQDIGAQIVLANTYHLLLRPGADVIEKLGGLHKFMAWDGPIMTDSGGFQVFSLGVAQEPLSGGRKLSKFSNIENRRHSGFSLNGNQPEGLPRISSANSEQIDSGVVASDVAPQNDEESSFIRQLKSKTGRIKQAKLTMKE